MSERRGGGRQVIQWASCCFSGEGTKTKHKQTMSVAVCAILGRGTAQSGYLMGKKLSQRKAGSRALLSSLPCRSSPHLVLFLRGSQAAGAEEQGQELCSSPPVPVLQPQHSGSPAAWSPRSSFRRAVWSGAGWVWVRDVAAEIKLPSAEGVWREGDCDGEGWGLGYPRPPAWEEGCSRVGWAPAGVWVLPRPWGGQPTAGHPQLTRARAKGPFLAPLLGGDCLICCCLVFFF